MANKSRPGVAVTMIGQDDRREDENNRTPEEIARLKAEHARLVQASRPTKPPVSAVKPETISAPIILSEAERQERDAQMKAEREARAILIAAEIEARDLATENDLPGETVLLVAERSICHVCRNGDAATHPIMREKGKVPSVDLSISVCLGCRVIYDHNGQPMSKETLRRALGLSLAEVATA